jgi:small-conductance mechanosensitive channel
MHAVVAVDVFADPDVSGWDVALAAVILVASLFVARAASNATTRLTARLEGLTDSARRGLARTAFWFVILLGIGVAFSALGADVQPLTTAAIVAAVVAIIAFRGVAGQFAAGIVLQTTHPYRVGDHVETLNHVGIVKELNSYATVVETYDGRVVHVPNAEILANPIINRSSAGGLRLDIEVRATITNPPPSLLTDLTEVTATLDGVVAAPAPIASLRAAEPGRITALVRAWHDPTIDGPTVAGAIIEALNQRLADLGVEAAIVTPPPPPPFTPPPPV